MPTTQLQRSNFPFSGRLVVLESDRTTGYDPFAGFDKFVAINFPAMPDSIELARSVEYLVVTNPVMPDGFHQYRLTQPMAIPFSFKLSSMDKDYCPRGALSVLELAALLHSFSLPIAKNASPLVYVRRAGASPSGPGGSTAAQEASAQAADTPYTIEAGSDTDEFYMPVTLRLELIWIDSNSPGVVCTGYVRDVSVKLNGPWLRGPKNSFNLPSSADFSFTFVHVPGHGNNFNIRNQTAVGAATSSQAYADTVKDKLYNTLELSAEGVGYKGYLKK
jgi:hypothetical protein